jgi:xanthosine utilization system XapX-like protein
MGLLAVFALIVLPLAPALLPESRTPERPRLDVPGAVTVTGGLLSLIYALSTAAERGFGETDVLVTLVAGLLLLAVFAVVETRSPAPLVSLPMLRRRTVAWGNLGGLITFSMMPTVVFVLTLYLQEILRLSAFETGLVFGFQGVMSVVAGSLTPRVVARFGARRTLVGSLAGQGVLTAGLLGLNAHSWSVWTAVAAVSLASMFHLGAIISYGLTATSGVPDEEQGLATGLVTSTQQVGITLGIPLLGVLATTADDLLSGVRTVIALDAAIVLVAAVVVGLGLRRGQSWVSPIAPRAAGSSPRPPAPLTSGRYGATCPHSTSATIGTPSGPRASRTASCWVRVRPSGPGPRPTSTAFAPSKNPARRMPCRPRQTV